MTVKDDLHQLVDELDEAAADELLEYARWLTADEDEPLTDEELARAHIRRPNLAVGAWALPTIIAHGTPEQQERFVGPTLLKLQISRRLHDTLFYVGLTLVAYGIFLTVWPAAWTPFGAKFTLPKVGWAGVFTIAIVFDLTAAFLAFFVLRKMKVPEAPPVPANGGQQAAVVPAH